MITHIRMKNFKSWKDSGEVQLAPLTGFFGTNSSGKSSLLQMLLLLKQTAERSDAEEVIFFGNEGTLVNLGNFQEVIHGHQHNEKLVFEFSCYIQTAFEIEVKGRKPDGNIGSVRVPIDNFTFNTTILGEVMKTMIEEFCYSFKSCGLSEFKWQSGRLKYIDLLGEQHIQRSNVFNCYGGPHQSQSHYQLNTLSRAFEEKLNNVYYLGPVRVDPRRRYDWHGEHPQHIKQWGNQTIDALLSARVRKLKTMHGDDEVAIDDKISDWLQQMDLAHSFTLDLTSQGTTNYEVRIQKTPSSPPVTLVDMGYGLAQFLPVLVLCFYAPEGSTLILEQPGIHLHPMVQSQLADLLIEVVNDRKLQILVESHSEHLLSRLQLRVAEEKIAANQTALYFCENENGTSKIKPLELDELGNIKNWPKDFFGNVRGDLLKMTREQMKRQKEAEG